MKNKVKRLIVQALTITLYTMGIYFSTLAPNMLGTIAMGSFFTALLIGTLYSYYRYNRADKKEKQQMDDQIPHGGDLLKIWYAPADSTELQYRKEKMQEKKRKKRL